MALMAGIEALEGRRMFAATAVLIPGGTLVVRGEAAETSLTVNEHAADPANGVMTNSVDVHEFVNGSGNLVGTFTNVKHIVIFGTTASDSIRYNGDDIGATIIGGGGNENLLATGGPNNLVIASLGNNTIIIGDNALDGTASTNAVVIAGTGTDRIVDDGTGTTIITANGADRIDTSADPTATVYVLSLSC